MRSLVCVLCLVLACCGHPFQMRDAVSAYDAGNYRQAADILSQYEDDPSALAFNGAPDPRVQLRFYTYLGLARYRAGDRPRALPPLREAKRLYAEDPAALPPQVARDLDAALADLGAR